MIQDKVAPIVFLLRVSLVETPPSGGQTLEDLSAFPVISQKDALTTKAEVPLTAYFASLKHKLCFHWKRDVCPSLLAHILTYIPPMSSRSLDSHSESLRIR